MRIIGVTGGTGCGKSTLLQVIAQRGGLCIDCDALYHELLGSDAALIDGIAAHFPTAVQNGVLQRKQLGKLVFADPAQLRILNGITHAAVCREVKKRLADAQAELAAIEAIALFESGLSALCGVTVAVVAPEEARIARLIAREGATRAYALARIHAQRSNEAFSALAQYTLENNGSPEAFRRSCEQFLDIMERSLS